MQGIVNILLGTRELVAFAGQCKKPDQSALTAFISPIVSCVNDLHSLAVNHAQSPSAPFYASLAEGAHAFTWITVCDCIPFIVVIHG
jgi:hypothetical protein